MTTPLDERLIDQTTLGESGAGSDDFDNELSQFGKPPESAQGQKTPEQIQAEKDEAAKKAAAENKGGEQTEEEKAAAAAATAAAEAEKKRLEDEKNNAVKPTEVPESIKKHFPDAKTIDEVAVLVDTKFADLKRLEDELKSANESNEEMVKILASDPALTEMMKDIRAGVPSFEAIRKYFELAEGETVPDPQKDPEKFKDYTKRQLERQARMDRQKQKNADADAISKKMEDRAVALSKSFREKTKMDDQTFEKFTGYIKSIIQGDPQNGIPDNFFDSLYNAYAFNDLMKQKEDALKAEYEKKIIEERNRIIENVKLGKPIGDGLPNFQSTKPNQQVLVDEFTDLESAMTSEDRVPIPQ
jgi:YesN/AraC family two-component response regulator